jgi:hypothetical protein
MKKLLIISLIVHLGVPSFAQEKPAASADKNVLKINTLALFLGTGSVFYEHKLGDMTSGQLGLAYLNFKLGDTRFSGLILTPEFRVYPKKDAISGFYVAPYLRYQKFTVENKVVDPPSKGSLTSMGGGLLFGRQWITNSGFTMDLFFGGHYGKADVKVDSGTNSFDSNFFNGFKMRVGFALGFSF